MMGDSPAGTARRLSGTGRSAIATIEIAGDLSQLGRPSPLFQAANGKPIHEQALNSLCFGVWGVPGEEVVLCRTGEASIEVTCHGGEAAAARVLGDVAARGFTREVLDVSAASLLSLARTQRTAEILLEQTSGVWEQFIAGLSQRPPGEAIEAINLALDWSEFGHHLVVPWQVVLCGRPNVGKSSLMNALAGFTRSIVSEQAGTTRDRVTLETAIDGWPVRITDTAGVRETSDPIEQLGVQQTLIAIAEADLTVIVLDASEPLLAEDFQLLGLATRRRIVVAHKSDLPVAEFVRILPDVADATIPENHIRVSSVTGQGVDSLLRAIATALVPELPPAGQPITVSRDQEQRLRGSRDLG